MQKYITATCLMSHVSHMRPWRNWYTRSTKDAVGQPLGVRFPLVAPNFQASAARVENLSVSAVLCADGRKEPTVVQCLGGALHRRTHVSYLMSHVSCLISHISYLISHISYLISHISYLMSHVSCLMSHISRLIPHFPLAWLFINLLNSTKQG